MKKLMSLICVLATLLVWVVPAYAASDAESCIEPRYTIIQRASATASVNESGVVTVSLTCIGGNDIRCNYRLLFEEDDGSYSLCHNFSPVSSSNGSLVKSARTSVNEHGEYRLEANFVVTHTASGESESTTCTYDFVY